MKKILFSLVVFTGSIFTVSHLQAQSVRGSEISIGISPLLPVGDISETHGFGIGGDVQYGYNFDESFGLTLSAGYNNLFGKEKNNVTYKDFGLVPGKAGVKYNTGYVYFHPQLGMGIPTSEAKVGNITGKYQPGFLYGIGVGTNVRGFDLSLRYEASDHKYKVTSGIGDLTSKDTKNIGFIGLRLGYTFPAR